jgi:hypothetical protein
MGLKHLEVAMEAGVICVLGSMGLFSDETSALRLPDGLGIRLC